MREFLRIKNKCCQNSSPKEWDRRRRCILFDWLVLFFLQRLLPDCGTASDVGEDNANEEDTVVDDEDEDEDEDTDAEEEGEEGDSST